MEAVAKEFFDSKVTMVVLNQSEEDERTGKKEHVVFLVLQTNQANKTGDQDHSSYRGVSVDVCAWSVYIYIYTLYVTSAYWPTCALCDFPQEALLRTIVTSGNHTSQDSNAPLRDGRLESGNSLYLLEVRYTRSQSECRQRRGQENQHESNQETLNTRRCWNARHKVQRRTGTERGKHRLNTQVRRLMRDRWN